MNLKNNTELIFQQIAEASQKANRDLDSVSVIAVTKYVDVETAEALLPLGVHHIGENRVDKFLEKSGSERSTCYLAFDRNAPET